MGTVSRPHPSRRVARHARPALDLAYEVALSDFPVELHEPIRRYHEARQAELEARGALTVAQARFRIDWWKIDLALRDLV
jgi:hypothetical protein